MITYTPLPQAPLPTRIIRFIKRDWQWTRFHFQMLTLKLLKYQKKRHTKRGGRG